MMPIQAYLVATHLDDLRREAAAARLARQVALGADDTFGGDSPRPSEGSDVRRTLARAAVRLSLLADDAARRLDPRLDEAFRPRRATEATGR
jgi:hypothetical protein